MKFGTETIWDIQTIFKNEKQEYFLGMCYFGLKSLNMPVLSWGHFSLKLGPKSAKPRD